MDGIFNIYYQAFPFLVKEMININKTISKE